MRFFVLSLVALSGTVSGRQFGIYEPITAESSARSIYFKPAMAAYEAAANANAAQVSAMFKNDHGPWMGSEMSASASEEITDSAYDNGYGSGYGMGSTEPIGASNYGYSGEMSGYGGDMANSYGGGSMRHGIIKGKEIVMSPKHKPITLHYRTHAQPIIVHQTRIPGPKPEVKHTMSHEEPHRVVHEVVRPIIQEVHEIIQPYRRIVQQVQPVMEEIQTIVAKDSGHSNSAMGISANSGLRSLGSGNEIVNDSIGNELGGEYASGSNVNKQFYRRALPTGPMTASQSQIYERKVERPRTFVNKRGVPVYHSNYGGTNSPQY